MEIGRWKCVIFGVFLGFALVLPSSAEGTENEMTYRIVSPKASERKLMESVAREVIAVGSAKRKKCGPYFNATETRRLGKVTYFAYRQELPEGPVTTIRFASAHQIDLVVQPDATAPTAVIREELGARITINLNFKDFKRGLSCLAAGLKA